MTLQTSPLRQRATRWPQLLAAAALLMAGLTAQAGGLDSLEQFVKHARSGKARFTQAVTAPGKDGQPPKTRTQSGSFEFQRPGKFRFDYVKPFEQTIVADGQTLWLYDVDLHQVTARRQQQALGATPAAIVAAASDLNTLRKDFTLTEEADRDGQQWVKAVPKTRDGQLQSVRVGFKPSPDTPTLSTLEIVDGFGQRSVLSFSGFEVNTPPRADAFNFRPPAGADVLKND